MTTSNCDHLAAGRKGPKSDWDYYQPNAIGHNYFFLAPRRRPRPATVFLAPLRVREFVRVR